MGNNKFKSIFDGVTDLEFEHMLEECEFDYRKVESGKGGLSIKDQSDISYNYMNNHKEV